MTWAPTERHRCILRLRAMLQSPLDRKRRQLGAPRRFPQLGVLIHQLKVARLEGAVSRSDGGVAPPASAPSPRRRLRSKHDVVVEVPIAPKKTVTADVSDTEASGDVNVEDSHELLFGKQGPPTSTSSSTGPLTAASLAALAAAPPTGPSPAEYAAVTQAAKGKKDTKRIATEPAHADGEAADDQAGALPAAKPKAMKSNDKVKKGPQTASVSASKVDPIFPCLAMQGSRAVVGNKVYSAARSLMKRHRSSQGSSMDDALSSARQYAQKCRVRWSSVWKPSNK
ncbi:unnamed protein product [Prorocentrum cordatum]|uniref:Uncharacterized protein n=1 Tax=Prorocentrum cordatum TaxID=2364126 RepID=A0ABN9UF34_9DINO|nr:unnamed protein product [Polarella glacialis]